MRNISPRAIRALALAAVLAIPATAAFAAGESNGPLPLPLPPSGAVIFGDTLPSINGNAGEPEAVNSLPPGFENDTLAKQHR